MAWNWAIVPGDVIEYVVTWVNLGQIIQNRFDILIGGAGTATSNQLLQGLDTEVANAFCPRISENNKHVSSRIQKITDCVISPNGNPVRVRGAMDRIYKNVDLDGDASAPFLPLGTTISVALITGSDPGKFWGRKSFGQLPETTTDPDGETVTALDYAAWQLNTDAFFVGAKLVPSTTLNWQAVMLPTTFVARLPLPHPALGTLVQLFLGTEVGPFVGSQESRRINPHSLS